MRLATALCALALAALPSTAKAADPLVDPDHGWDPDGYVPRPIRLPRFMAEVKLGAYSPRIDNTDGLTGKPFSDLFQNQFDKTTGTQPGGALVTTLEFDWEFWHRFGSLGLGASVGYSRRKTHGFNLGPGNTPCVVPNCVRSGDETALNVFPLTLELVYRFNVLAFRYHVPFVPYAKAGFGYYIWFIQRGDSSIATVQTPTGLSHGAGGVAGLVFHPGIAFLLDVIEPPAARTLLVEAGIKHTYLFGELSAAWITGLGFHDKIDLSDVGWNVGMSVEF